MACPWDSMECLWSSMEFHRVPWSVHGVPDSSMGFYLVFMKCPPGVSIEFHGSVLENLKCTTYHGGTMKSVLN